MAINYLITIRHVKGLPLGPYPIMAVVKFGPHKQQTPVVSVTPSGEAQFSSGLEFQHESQNHDEIAIAFWKLGKGTGDEEPLGHSSFKSEVGNVEVKFLQIEGVEATLYVSIEMKSNPSQYHHLTQPVEFSKPVLPSELQQVEAIPYSITALFNLPNVQKAFVFPTEKTAFYCIDEITSNFHEKQKGRNVSFGTHIYLTSGTLFECPVQQIEGSVWDIPSLEKIVNDKRSQNINVSLHCSSDIDGMEDLSERIPQISSFAVAQKLPLVIRVNPQLLLVNPTVILSLAKQSQVPFIVYCDISLLYEGDLSGKSVCVYYFGDSEYNPRYSIGASLPECNRDSLLIAQLASSDSGKASLLQRWNTVKSFSSQLQSELQKVNGVTVVPGNEWTSLRITISVPFKGDSEVVKKRTSRLTKDIYRTLSKESTSAIREEGGVIGFRIFWLFRTSSNVQRVPRVIDSCISQAIFIEELVPIAEQVLKDHPLLHPCFEGIRNDYSDIISTFIYIPEFYLHLKGKPTLREDQSADLNNLNESLYSLLAGDPKYGPYFQLHMQQHLKQVFIAIRLPRSNQGAVHRPQAAGDDFVRDIFKAVASFIKALEGSAIYDTIQSQYALRGIHLAEQELKTINDQDSLLRHVPLVSGVVNWWWPEKQGDSINFDMTTARITRSHLSTSQPS